MNRLKTFWTQLEFKRSHAGHILLFQSCSSRLGGQLKVHPHSSTITFLLFFYENNRECRSKKYQYWGIFSDDADIPASPGVGDERK